MQLRVTLDCCIVHYTSDYCCFQTAIEFSNKNKKKIKTFQWGFGENLSKDTRVQYYTIFLLKNVHILMLLSIPFKYLLFETNNDSKTESYVHIKKLL